MPITLAKIASNTASVTFSYQGDSANVVYYPGRITEKTLAQLRAFEQANEATMGSGFEIFNEVLVNLIKSWDVFEDESETVMFPLDPVRLSELPIPLRSAVLNAITSDQNPNQQASQATPIQN